MIVIALLYIVRLITSKILRFSMDREEPTKNEELYMKVVSRLNDEFSEREMLFVLEALDDAFDEVYDEKLFAE